MEDKEPLTIQEIVETLSNIDKDELSEREFLQQVLSTIKHIEKEDLTEENFEQISATLKQIGCVDYKTWSKEKEKQGFKMANKPIKVGASEGLLSAGVTLVEQFLFNYNRAKNGLERMTEGGEKSGWLQMWLRNSKKVLSGAKINSDLEFEFYEPTLSSEKELSEREKEEQAIKEAIMKREELKAEISSLQQQIDELQKEEATLRNSKIRKQLELNDLEEK